MNENRDVTSFLVSRLNQALVTLATLRGIIIMYFSVHKFELNLFKQLVVFSVVLRWFGDGELVYLVCPRGVDSSFETID